MNTSQPLPELIAQLMSVGIAARGDRTSRLLYSTDASIYQIEPIGVAFPRHPDEIQAIVEACIQFHVPVTMRGAGSGLAGGAIGSGLIVDCARFMNRIIEIDPERRTVTAEPGVVLNALNREARRYGLQFGPDPASGERATLGGSIANNAAGAHSIRYGMCIDHILEAEVTLSDASRAVLKEVSLEEARRFAGGDGSPRPKGENHSYNDLSAEGRLYASALDLRERYGDAIKMNWPRTWRRASGYAINYLLPWTPSGPPLWSVDPAHSSDDAPYPPVSPGHINLAQLLGGAEGTLALIHRTTVGLVPLPQQTLLAVYTFPGMVEACEATPLALEHSPSAVELIPGALIRLARAVPAYAAQLSILNDLGGPGSEPPAVLVVEFSGPDAEALLPRAEKLFRAFRQQNGSASRAVQMLTAASAPEQAQVWTVRKVGLGLIMSRASDWRPYSFIEDLTVPVERLGEFMRGIERILIDHEVDGETYGHASAGCLHIRPIINLKRAAGVQQMRELAQEAVRLTISLGGTVSGEHGDGLSRSEWTQAMFGETLVDAFRSLKQAADPDYLLNPGKKVSLNDRQLLPRMDENLRFGSTYRAFPWEPNLHFRVAPGPEGPPVDAGNQRGRELQATGQPAVSSYPAVKGLEIAIEQCNGAGVCRKVEGVMCPSYQATHEEMHSTRGRSNLLRALISGKFSSVAEGEAAVKDALDLCLACKGCKAECPSAVDVARLKYEFFDHYYRSHRRKLRDYLFGYIGPISRLALPFAPLVNVVLGSRIFGNLAERWLGISSRRRMPAYAFRSLHGLSDRKIVRIASYNRNQPTGHTNQDYLTDKENKDVVLFLSDPFTEYMNPAVGQAALHLLEGVGVEARLLPVIGAGRTLISKGFLDAARKQARAVMSAIEHYDPQGILPVLCAEPSELHTLFDEYPDLLPNDDRVPGVARRAWSVEEFLLRPGMDNRPRWQALLDGFTSSRYQSLVDNQADSSDAVDRVRPSVYLHGHCYQKARPPADDGLPVGVQASAGLLEALGFFVTVIDSGCCGMAGAFGYETEHIDLSLQVGELKLFPAIRAADPGMLVAAAGVSCREQIEDGAKRSALHPVQIAETVLNNARD